MGAGCETAEERPIRKIVAALRQVCSFEIGSCNEITMLALNQRLHYLLLHAIRLKGK